MRLWTLHPRYLDPQGLVALWREGLLAQAVLKGQTRGYKHHPQLIRFLETAYPVDAIACYLNTVCEEAASRGYRFDAGRIQAYETAAPMTATEGQVAYEWQHLWAKLARRSPAWLARFETVMNPDVHPLFRRIPGGIAAWEIVQTVQGRRVD